MWVPSLGWEVPLEKEMTTHSSILAWKFSWTEEPGGLQSTGLQRATPPLWGKPGGQGNRWETEGQRLLSRPISACQLLEKYLAAT